MTEIDERPADVRDMYAVHDVFLREFGLMPGLVRGVTSGDTERTEIVAAHITLLDDMLHHHHHAEDGHLWPRLLERGTYEIAPIVQVMQEQHQGIDGVNDQVRTALATWRLTADAALGTRLADALDRLNERLQEHLKLEEEQALPLIEKYITAGEWGQMLQEAGKDVSPEQMPLLFGLMMYEGDPEVVAMAIAQMPPELQPVIDDIAGRAFAEHSERVHGTPTPPRIARA